MIFNKNNITEKDLQDLIDNQILEDEELEYKDYSFAGGKLSSISNDEKNKLVKEIAAFANTNGGNIILGIEDDKGLPIKLNGTGLNKTEVDSWISAFRQVILSRIRPHLHGVKYKPIELSNKDICILIIVPKSYSKPHSFWDGNKNEFNIRNVNGMAAMDIEDLRKIFLYPYSIQNQIREFRRDRISMILSNEIIGNLDDGGKLIYHLIPEWSFELGNHIDIATIQNNHENLTPLTLDSGGVRFNIDGYCIYSNNYSNKNITSYSQLFRNGIIEAVDVQLMSGNESNRVSNWQYVQHQIIKATERYTYLLQKYDIPKPWHLFISIINAKGFYTNVNYGFASKKLDRDIINSVDSTWKDDDVIDQVLKPVLDSLSNAFGYSKSSCFDNEGKIISD